VSQDATYQGLVALLAGYVGGNWRIDMVVDNAYEKMQKARDNNHNMMGVTEEDERVLASYKRVQENIEPADMKHYILTREHPMNTGVSIDDLQTVINHFMAPRAAKMMVPVLSRSSLAELKAKTRIPDAAQFKAHVVAAAGLQPEHLKQRLFPFGLDTPGHKTRSIEARPDITIDQWLQSIIRGKNLTFSDETKRFEDVGPRTPSCCFFTSRAQGAVLEIRALDDKRLVPLGSWRPLAKTVVEVYQRLNRRD
jgi:hypothetical protein